MKKKAATRARKADPKKLADVMGRAIAAYLASQSWRAMTIGPCEMRVQHAYMDGKKVGDPSGKTLGQYEFIVKFYGHKMQETPDAHA